MNDLSRNIGEAIVAPGMTISEPRVVDAEEMQNCGVKIVNVHPFLRDRCPDFVSTPVADSPFGPTAG